MCFAWLESIISVINMSLHLVGVLGIKIFLLVMDCFPVFIEEFAFALRF